MGRRERFTWSKMRLSWTHYLRETKREELDFDAAMKATKLESIQQMINELMENPTLYAAFTAKNEVKKEEPKIVEILIQRFPDAMPSNPPPFGPSHPFYPPPHIPFPSPTNSGTIFSHMIEHLLQVMHLLILMLWILWLDISRASKIVSWSNSQNGVNYGNGGTYTYSTAHRCMLELKLWGSQPHTRKEDP